MARTAISRFPHGGAIGPAPAANKSPDETRAAWLDAFRRVRAETEARASHLSAEDQIVQSMADASPTKWHRAHVTWFFETISAGAERLLLTRFSTNAFRFCSTPITSPPVRATRARSAA